MDSLLEKLRADLYGDAPNLTASTFFDPDSKFIDWIIEHANGRMIIDIGCGNGHVLRQLHKAGHKKLMGFDPFTDMIEFNQKAMEECGERIHFMPLDVGSERFFNFVEPMKDSMEVMFLLCRPCHNGVLVDGSFKIAKKLGIELLYIGLEDNIEIDLGTTDDGIPYERLNHKGSSGEDEIVLKLG